MTVAFTLSVPDMSCGHCRASISAALDSLGAATEFDTERRQVHITGNLAPAAAVAALDRIGFPAEPV